MSRQNLVFQIDSEDCDRNFTPQSTLFCVCRGLLSAQEGWNVWRLRYPIPWS